MTNPLLPWIERWLDTRLEFRWGVIRSCGPFLIETSEIMVNQELLPDCLLVDPRALWSPSEWGSGVRELFAARQLPMCQVYHRAGNPEEALKLLREYVLKQVEDLTNKVQRWLKRPDKITLDKPSDYLDTARKYVFLNRVLRQPLVTPAFAPLLNNTYGQAATGRKHFANYVQAVELIEAIVKGYAELGYDPGPLGLAELGTNASYARLRARQIANKLQGKRADTQ